jgi:hypothetical protein
MVVPGSRCPSEAIGCHWLPSAIRVTDSSTLHATQAAPAGKHRHTAPTRKAVYVCAVSTSPARCAQLHTCFTTTEQQQHSRLAPGATPSSQLLCCLSPGSGTSVCSSRMEPPGPSTSLQHTQRKQQSLYMSQLPVCNCIWAACSHSWYVGS